MGERLRPAGAIVAGRSWRDGAVACGRCGGRRGRAGAPGGRHRPGSQPGRSSATWLDRQPKRCPRPRPRTPGIVSSRRFDRVRSTSPRASSRSMTWLSDAWAWPAPSSRSCTIRGASSWPSGTGRSDRRLDTSSYDLLASEARLASYVAIASGQLPFDHWFALGRRLTTAHGRQVLLSWSGSMFEYLMPRLVMPDFAGTLLDQTCIGAVARQIEYGRQRRVPWGISESCYNAKDVEGTYQYRAFGVPGLGLQRGLGDDDGDRAVRFGPGPAGRSAARNREPATHGRARLAWAPMVSTRRSTSRPPASTRASRTAVVKAFFAHHHGMSLLALEQAVLGPQMQRRFLSNPDFRAATLLLQERIPKTNVLMYPHAREVAGLATGSRTRRRSRSCARSPTRTRRSRRCICSPTAVTT